ncbi:hypothetical protein OH733_05230 [Streptomyces griseus]|uniref:hypothetical protein n=1 Tax=Streptomyces griseus TaxID=1911 RepID=UPI00386D7B79|nr:hypothetical protein OH733_05230 [Streptomyces griseus]WTD71197.1 hypothetical protein OH763_31755 [Streptomyces griseus]
MAHGWKYVNGELVYRPDTDRARVNVLAELDTWEGEEYERLRGLLDSLVDAVRRDWAEKIRKHELDDPMGRNFYTGAGADYYAQLISPDEEDPK